MDERAVARGRELQREIERCVALCEALRAERDQVVAVLRDGGASQRQVARALGLTCARVAQLDIARAKSLSGVAARAS